MVNEDTLLHLTVQPDIPPNSVAPWNVKPQSVIFDEKSVPKSICFMANMFTPCAGAWKTRNFVELHRTIKDDNSVHTLLVKCFSHVDFGYFLRFTVWNCLDKSWCTVKVAVPCGFFMQHIRSNSLFPTRKIECIATHGPSAFRDEIIQPTTDRKRLPV